MFIRKGGAKQPLAQLYEGPYKVIPMSGAVVNGQVESTTTGSHKSSRTAGACVQDDKAGS